MNSNKEGFAQELPAAADPADAGQPLIRASFDWLSAGQFAFSLLAVLSLGSIAVISALLVIAGIPSGGPDIQHNQVISSLLFAAGLGFAGLLLIPSAVHSGKRLFTERTSAVLRWERLVWLAAIFPVFIYIGYLIQSGPEWTHYLLPGIHVLANGAGLIWVLNLVRRRLPPESAQRSWGVFGVGLTLTPLITFFIEILILIMVGIFWIFLIQTNAGLEQDFLNFSNFIYGASGESVIPPRIGEFIARPEISGTIFLYFSFFIPLVEELLKPLAVYILLGRKLLPWEGFVMGATAGAGYALFENLTIGATAEAWTFVIVSRIGTAAVHILTTGMVGWGLASAWSDRKYGRLAGSFIAAVALHGVWNGLNILTALAELEGFGAQISPFFLNFANYAPVGLFVLALGSMVGLLRANSRLRRAIIAQD